MIGLNRPRIRLYSLGLNSSRSNASSSFLCVVDEHVLCSAVVQRKASMLVLAKSIIPVRLAVFITGTHAARKQPTGPGARYTLLCCLRYGRRLPEFSAEDAVLGHGY